MNQNNASYPAAIHQGGVSFSIYISRKKHNLIPKSKNLINLPPE